MKATGEENIKSFMKSLWEKIGVNEGGELEGNEVCMDITRGLRGSFPFEFFYYYCSYIHEI